VSVRTGITSLCNVTLGGALIALGYAAKAITYFRNWWKRADPFKRYRVVQVPIEILGVTPGFVVINVGRPFEAPIVFDQLSILLIAMAILAMGLGMAGRGWLLRRVREAWILPDPLMGFTCVRCRHGAISHSSHPRRKCPSCKARWKDQWADYWKRPLSFEMHVDDFDPGMTW
jgi:hypothetical protein